MEAVGQKPPAKKGFKLLSSSSNAIGHKTRMGFNLIEAAIVLAVVGGVIGAIWVAAAHFYEEYKVNKTVADLQLIVTHVQELMSIRDAETLGGIVEITSTLIAANAFPKDWINGSSLKSPFGGTVSSFSYPGTNASFSIRLFDLPRHICIKLVVKVSSIAGKAGNNFSRPSLGQIQVNYPTWWTGDFPVSAQQAEAACTNTQDDVYFYYGYTRIN